MSQYPECFAFLWAPPRVMRAGSALLAFCSSQSRCKFCPVAQVSYPLVNKLIPLPAETCTSKADLLQVLRSMTCAGNTFSDITEAIGLNAEAQTLAAGTIASGVAAQVCSLAWPQHATVK